MMNHIGRKVIVAIFSILGIFLIPYNAHAQDERQSFPNIDTMSPLGVDLQTGRFVKEGAEFSIGPLVVDHYVKYTSPGGGQRPLMVFATSLHGRSWNFQSGTIGQGFSNRQIIQIGRQQVIFNIPSSGDFFPLDSSTTGWKMVASGNQHLLTYKNGTLYRFDQHPALNPRDRVLVSTETPDGHVVTNHYDSSGRLKQVKSNRGYAVVLDYSNDNVVVCGYNLAVHNINITSNCAGSKLTAIYGFNAGRLTSITNAKGDVVCSPSASMSPNLRCELRSVLVSS
ncbi:hypothetical protein ACR9YC_07095 [Parasphingorhabdus sp. DH2-15]|uniref:hypothetical protein n=1 Tax=Parasphingorhabdus sp. DH2-15 TaxID=3444112 RepID=UPI003F6866E1